VVPSAIPGEALDENIFHAHVLPEGRDYYEMATQLFCLFSEHGKAEHYKHELSLRERWLFVCAWFLRKFRDSPRE
jgi:hypothetical protein